MKIRHSFVTNSSSSSYVCSVCGCDESGWDLCLSDVAMTTCANSHTFCDSHAKEMSNKESIKAYMKKCKIYKEETFEEEYESGEFDCYLNDIRYDAPVEMCPVCQFDTLCDDDGLKYIMKKHGLTKESILANIKAEFDNYKKFVDYMEG